MMHKRFSRHTCASHMMHGQGKRQALISLGLVESRILHAAPADVRPRTHLISLCTVQLRTLCAARSLAALCLSTISGPGPGELPSFWAPWYSLMPLFFARGPVTTPRQSNNALFGLTNIMFLNTRKHNRKICSKMITSIIRYHTAIHYIMSITRDRFRPYWVSSGGCKKHSIINMLKKNKFAIGCKKKKKKKKKKRKKEKSNAKQYDTAIPISWGSHSRTHTHDMDNKSHR